MNEVLTIKVGDIFIRKDPDDTTLSIFGVCTRANNNRFGIKIM